MGLPRLWVTVWSIYASADLAKSSEAKQLSYVESLYQFSDQLEGTCSLDDAITRVDLEKLGRILEAFFVSIRNQPTVSESAEIKWRTAFKFVSETVLRLSKSNLSLDKINEIEARLNRFNLLYQQLRIGQRKKIMLDLGVGKISLTDATRLLGLQDAGYTLAPNDGSCNSNEEPFRRGYQTTSG